MKFVFYAGDCVLKIFMMQLNKCNNVKANNFLCFIDFSSPFYISQYVFGPYYYVEVSEIGSDMIEELYGNEFCKWQISGGNSV